MSDGRGPYEDPHARRVRLRLREAQEVSLDELREDSASEDDPTVLRSLEELGLSTGRRGGAHSSTFSEPPRREMSALYSTPGGTEDEHPTLRMDLRWDEDEPTLIAPDFTGLSAELNLTSAIGRGGMAEIFSAQQPALSREVAVKRLRKDRGDRTAVRRLLSEARVQAILEHPNVVPIHMLRSDEMGRPAIVMRRVSGQTWRSFVGSGGRALKAPDPDVEPLEWHLRVLMQICGVVHYAHGKGVLHRDIKLTNVLIGPSSQPYLLDWGFAIGFGPNRPEGLLRPEDESDVVGTPGYMAPEMAAVAWKDFGPATDVYLLGACLHTLLTGEHRHSAVSRVEQVARAYASRPAAYDPSVPAELGHIANKACARLPEDRYPDAEAFRRALERYLRHRTSLELADEARRSLVRLERVLSTSAGRPRSKRDEGRVHELAGEASFGLQQALRRWPENPRALEGMRRLRIALLEHEIGRGDADRASVLLDDLNDPPTDIRRQVDVLQAEAEAGRLEIEHLRRRAADADLRVGSAARRRLLLQLSGLWGGILAAFAGAAGLGLVRAGTAEIQLLLVLQALILTLASLRLRDHIAGNRAGRQFLAILGLSALGPLVLWPLGAAAGMALPFAVALLHLCWGATGLVAAIAQDRRFAASGAIFASAALLTVLVPDQVLGLLAVGVPAGLATAAWAAGAGEFEVPTPGDGALPR